MKRVLISVALLIAMLTAAPSEYTIKQWAGATVPAIDGDISEWADSLFIDSLRSDDNVYARSASLDPWTPAQFQYKLYLAYTSSPINQGTLNASDTGYIYGAAIVTRDPDYVVGHGWSADNMKINPGGQAQAFYINSDGTAPTLNQYSPYTLDTTLFATCMTYGNAADSLPTYEFALRRDVTDPFAAGIFQASFGSEEYKTGNLILFCAVGAEYTENKQDWGSNPWDQTFYYPSFSLATTAVEMAPVKTLAATAISASPNPFLPATTISYSAQNDGVIKIFNAAGKLIKREAIKAGNGKVNFNGQNLASGVYIARLETGKSVVNTKLFLTR